jgi:hypothetical protein
MTREEYGMTRKLLAIVVAAGFVAASGAAWGQAAVGGNTVPKYGNVEASKNRTHTKHGVAGNAVPTYTNMEASKNKKVTKHGVGGNAEPTYPVTTKQ